VRRRDEGHPVVPVVVEHDDEPADEQGDPHCEPGSEHCDLHDVPSAGPTGRLSLGSVVPVTPIPVRETIEREREATLVRIAELHRSFDDIAASVDTANTDDEHDPEGATLAFERAQVLTLLEAAELRLAELDDAAERLRAGTYGTCTACGRRISDERLAARPDASRCIDCAQAGAVRG
jgi:RNA polymerase-binding transcription factor DksA